MHISAIHNYEAFLQKYVAGAGLNVLDVGSYDVNGSLKPSTVNHVNQCRYVGLDMCTGPNVDVVGNSHDIPFDAGHFDLVISTSCFEHDEMFWVTFKEIARVTKSGGFIYICAPSNGPYHGHPGDCWRFYKDSWSALEKWSGDVKMVESYIDDRPDHVRGDVWKDSIGIYTKI